MNYQEILALRNTYKKFIGKEFTHKLLQGIFRMQDITAAETNSYAPISNLNDEQYINEIMYKDLGIVFLFYNLDNHQLVRSSEKQFLENYMVKK